MKAILALSILMAGTACAHAADPVAEPKADTKQIHVKQTVYPDPISAASVFAANFPESLEGKQKLTVLIEKNPDNPGQLLVTITQDHPLDDSVEAQQSLVKLAPVTGGWQLAGLTRRSKCARGSKAGQWTVGSCL